MSKAIPIANKIFTQPYIVVGVILEKDGKFLLVQEGKVDIGEWNIPAGWLDLNEDLIEGAKRETKEESGLEIEITGFLGIYAGCKVRNNQINHCVRIIFAAKPLSYELNYPKGEILDARWFSTEELELMKDKLRSITILPQIKDYLAGKIYPLEAIKPFVTRI
ncbi:MAG: NUDIX domain-containing protein [Candidatus Parcubacteria bacterium]|nr:NUDIX domain-containing protein [Candidatus Parcubacteria bacterium]